MVNSGFSGADVAQVRALAARMKGQSSKLREVATSSTVALLAAEWTGNDIDAIRNNWRRSSLPTIERLADILHDMGVELEGQARAQEEVSGGASAGGSGSWLDGIRDWFQRTIPRILGPFPFSGSDHPSGPPSHQLQPDHEAPGTPEQAVVPETPRLGRGATTGSIADPPVSQDSYDHRAGNVYTGANGTKYSTDPGWCTSWVQFRRDQLGLPVPHGHGGAMAGSLADRGSEPSLGAVGSWGAGTQTDPGHTFVVEAINPGSPRTVTISEMNADDPKNPNDGFGRVSSATYTEVSSGVWRDQFGHTRNVTFGQ